LPEKVAATAAGLRPTRTAEGGCPPQKGATSNSTSSPVCPRHRVAAEITSLRLKSGSGQDDAIETAPHL